MKTAFKASARRFAVLGICALALMILPGTPVWATARALGARTLAFVGRAWPAAPAFGRSASPAAGTPTITPTMTATLTTDSGGEARSRGSPAASRR